MDKLVVKELIRQLTISGIFILLVFLFVKIFYSVQSEKRIASFSMETKNNEELSFIDMFISFIKKIIHKIAQLLGKSVFFKRYGDYLSKNLLYANTSIDGLHLIAIKFIVMIIMQFIYLFTLLLNTNKFNIISFMLLSILAFMLLDILVIFLYKQEKKVIEEQLLQAIVIMNSAFKSGKNITEAIMIVKKELPNPIKDEFEIIYKDISYGLSLNDAFSRLYKRINLEEAKYITASLSLLSKTGGNIVTVFNMIEKNFYNRLKIRNELGALTASSKFLYRLLIAMPFIFILVIIALNPTYFSPLIENRIGHLIILIMVLLYSLYLVVIRKIMKVNEV